jgi:hypothetical protein
MSFSPVDAVPSWFSILMYQQGDEQARWWPQLRYVVSSHRHDDDRHHHACGCRHSLTLPSRPLAHRCLVDFIILRTGLLDSLKNHKVSRYAANILNDSLLHSP